MRIGIHLGPVTMGQVGSSATHTAVGDTVQIATRLETDAPVDGVLISDTVFELVQGLFDVQPLDPMMIEGQSALMPVYVVKREKPRAFRVSPREVEGVETRMIGRNEAL